MYPRQAASHSLSLQSVAHTDAHVVRMSFDTERFIVEIQNRPCLWDSSISDYSNRNLKISCWDELVNLFKEKDEMTVQEKKQFGKYIFINLTLNKLILPW